MKKMFYLLFAIIVANMAYAQTVEFRCNMSVQIKKGLFTPGTDVLSIAGTLNNWTPNVDMMTDADNDSIYSFTSTTLAVDDTVQFKFVKNASTWESIDNRQYIVPSGNSSYTGYFDNDSIYTQTTPVTIYFSVNMEYEKVSGRFNPSTDTVDVRGSFNGWSSNTPVLNPDPTDPNLYVGDTIVPLSVGDEIASKFVYRNGSSVTWENDPNHIYTVTQEDFDNGYLSIDRVYNDLDPSTVTGWDCTIKFVVDMNGAISHTTGQPFASVERVGLAGANAPLRWPGNGWPDSDSSLCIMLYDNGMDGDVTAGDGKFSKDVTFAPYSPLHITYKYGANFGLPDLNTGSNDNEAAAEDNHHIFLTHNMVSATVNNVFGQNDTTELSDVVLGIKELGSAVPKAYSLDQNYPNPFNPTTNINFSITKPGMVTLKVYNILGQEVATLVNEYKEAKTYTVDFNATNLTSGIYFYTVTSGNFTATKKMMLLK